MTLIGRVPTRGEIIGHPSGVEFEVLEGDPRRVRSLRIRNLPENDGDEAQEAVEYIDEANKA